MTKSPIYFAMYHAFEQFKPPSTSWIIRYIKWHQYLLTPLFDTRILLFDSSIILRIVYFNFQNRTSVNQTSSFINKYSEIKSKTLSGSFELGSTIFYTTYNSQHYGIILSGNITDNTHSTITFHVYFPDFMTNLSFYTFLQFVSRLRIKIGAFRTMRNQRPVSEW